MSIKVSGAPDCSPPQKSAPDTYSNKIFLHYFSLTKLVGNEKKISSFIIQRVSYILALYLRGTALSKIKPL